MLSDVMSDEQVNTAIRENAVMRISQELTRVVNNPLEEDVDGNRRGMLDYQREVDEGFAGSIDFVVAGEKLKATLHQENMTCQWVGPDEGVVQRYASLLDIDPAIVSNYFTMGWEVIKAAYPTAMVMLNDPGVQGTPSMYFYADGIYFAVYIVAYADPSNNTIV